MEAPPAGKQSAVIMIQGTASHVGKSMIATALCVFCPARLPHRPF